jgi:2-oxoglutarate dehydrogenase E1 component
MQDKCRLSDKGLDVKIWSLQVNGHSIANLDPLGLHPQPMPLELDPDLYGFTDKDLDRE